MLLLAGSTAISTTAGRFDIANSSSCIASSRGGPLMMAGGRASTSGGKATANGGASLIITGGTLENGNAPVGKLWQEAKLRRSFPFMIT